MVGVVCRVTQVSARYHSGEANWQDPCRLLRNGTAPYGAMNTKGKMIMTDRYHDFDQALLAQLRAGRNIMRQLDADASGVRELAWLLCTRGLLSRPISPPRLIDERLREFRSGARYVSRADFVNRFRARSWSSASWPVHPTMAACSNSGCSCPASLQAHPCVQRARRSDGPCRYRTAA